MVVALVLCAAAGASIGVDPMLVIEVGVAALLAIWTALLGHDLWRAEQLRRQLDAKSCFKMIDGVRVRVIRGGAVEAFVLGILRPTVYVGDESMTILEADELAAVVHHEDHHRRTLAPLRAAAVGAWLQIVGRSPSARRLLSARLAALEASADAHAMRRGVRPASIAAALVKIERVHSAGPAFSGAADHRIRALLDAAAARPAQRTMPLPYEWLPLVIAAGMKIACHLRGACAIGSKGWPRYGVASASRPRVELAGDR